MFGKSKYLSWGLIIICAVLSVIGIFQLGYLIGLAIYSIEFSFSSVTMLQVSLISTGILAISEFVRSIKKLKTEPMYN